MKQEDIARAAQTYQKLREEARKEIKQIYGEIEKELSGVSIINVPGELAVKETKRLTDYVSQFTKRVKDATIEEMKQCGCKEYLTQMGWSEMTKDIKLPVIELCKSTQKMSDGTPINSEKQLADLEAKRNASAGAAIAGAVIDVITLAVPGWNAVHAAVLVVGSAMIIVGGAGVVMSTKEINEAKAKEGQSKPSMSDIIGKIVMAQVKCNTDIICSWANEVEAAFPAECDKLLGM